MLLHRESLAMAFQKPRDRLFVLFFLLLFWRKQRYVKSLQSKIIEYGVKLLHYWKNDRFGFKLHLACNDRGEIIAFVLTGANVRDKDPNVCKVLAKRLYGKLFADKGYISQKLFDFLFEDGIQLVTGLRVNMKNKLMPFYDRMMLRKRYIIETINDMLKNTAQIVHSRHRSVSNFIMNLISALGAFCFFDNKPKALQGYCIEDTKQLTLF